MVALYITGDVHSKVENRFSFRQHPELRNLAANDFMFIAGDFGAVWDWTGNSKEDLYKLNFVNSKPWTTIVVLGNHECWPLYQEMPSVIPDFVYSGSVRQCVYMGKTFEHIYIVDSITILDIEDKHILCIPGADSVDKAWRTEGESWWPQEAIDVESCLDFMELHDTEHFDYIITHDAPAQISEWYSDGFGRIKSNYGQKYLDLLRVNLDFDFWFTGHFHFTGHWPQNFYNPNTQITQDGYDKRMFTIYEKIMKMEDVSKEKIYFL